MVAMVMVMVMKMKMVMLMVMMIDAVHPYIHLGGWRCRHKPPATFHDFDIPVMRWRFLRVV